MWGWAGCDMWVMHMKHEQQMTRKEKHAHCSHRAVPWWHSLEWDSVWCKTLSQCGWLKKKRKLFLFEQSNWKRTGRWQTGWDMVKSKWEIGKSNGKVWNETGRWWTKMGDGKIKLEGRKSNWKVWNQTRRHEIKLGDGKIKLGDEKIKIEILKSNREMVKSNCCCTFHIGWCGIRNTTNNQCPT